jgi:hypothetical protein
MQATKLFAIVALLFGLSIARPAPNVSGVLSENGIFVNYGDGARKIHRSNFAISVLRVNHNSSPGFPNSSP